MPILNDSGCALLDDCGCPSPLEHVQRSDAIRYLKDLLHDDPHLMLAREILDILGAKYEVQRKAKAKTKTKTRL